MHTLIKSIATLAVLAATWVDKNLSPLFWILVVLACVDILINIHDIEKQWKKLGAAFFGLGLPSYLASNSGSLMTPDVMKVLVATLTIGYVQVVIPDVVKLIKSLTKNPVKQAEEQAVGNAVEAYLTKKAEAEKATAEADSLKDVHTGGISK